MHWSKKFRLLIVIYGLTLLGATWEISQGVYTGDKAPTKEARADARLFEMQFASVQEQLFPGNPRSRYHEGIIALFDQPPRLEEARHQFEAALATGIKTDEQLLYYYAVTLVMLEEDPKQIDEAISNWRWNFPHSKNIDPRQAKLSAGMPRQSRP